MTQNNTLLPSGFEDVLPPKAAQESRTVSKLMKNLAAFGYQQIKPPVIEFENSLLDNASEGVKKQTFRVMDPQSKEMLAIRADMTTQVARIATTRLKDEPRPLRVSYAGQVLRVSGEGLYKERQMAQAGAELVGIDTVNADAESVIIAVETLAKTGLNDISVDFNLPALPKLLGAEEELLDAITHRDKNKILELAGANREVYQALLEGKDLQSVSLPENAKKLVQRLQDIIAVVSRACPELSLSVDPLEHEGFEYYTGFSFTIYSKKNDEALGRGGRYVIGNKGETASGFSLSVNAVLRALPAAEKKKIKEISIDTPLDEIRGLQSQDLVTIYKHDSEN